MVNAELDESEELRITSKLKSHMIANKVKDVMLVVPDPAR